MLIDSRTGTAQVAASVQAACSIQRPSFSIIPDRSHTGMNAEAGTSPRAGCRQPTCASYPTGGTSLYGPVRDEADVSSILARILDHGLSVVEVRSLPD